MTMNRSFYLVSASMSLLGLFGSITKVCALARASARGATPSPPLTTRCSNWSIKAYASQRPRLTQSVSHLTEEAEIDPTSPLPNGAGPSPPGPNRLGLKKNFSWALAGDMIYQSSQWLNLIILAKLLDVVDVGRYALAMAICMPICAMSSMNLRVVQVTDTRDRHQFGHFLAVQLASSTIGILLIIAIAGLSGYEPDTVWAIIIVGLGQTVVMIREVFIAYNQKQERMDTVAVSNTLLGLGSLLVMGTLVWATRSLLIGITGMVIAKLLVLLFWDVRNTARLMAQYAQDSVSQGLGPNWKWRAMWTLFWMAIPLGVSNALMSLSSNMPRYLIAGFLDTEQLGYYAAITALAVASYLVSRAAGMSTLPRLSRYHNNEDYRAFFGLLWKLVGLAICLGLVGILIVWVAGEFLLLVLFTEAYVAYVDLFLWSMVFAAIALVATALNYGVLAMRQFNVMPIVQGCKLVAISIAGFFMIPAYGINGGAYAMIVANGILAIILGAVIFSNHKNRNQLT